VSLFDLFFLASFLGCAVAVLRIAYRLARGRLATARRAAARLTAFVACYAAVLVAVSLAAPGRTLPLGERLCFDEWCMAVAHVSRQSAIGDAHAGGVFYVVTLEISSRSRGRRQREINTYRLRDGGGRTFDVSPAGQAALRQAGLAAEPASAFVDPGRSFESRLVFDVPRDAAGLGLVKASPGWLQPGRFIIGEPASFFHRPTVMRLDRP
jgi:hypothetical protein